MRLFLSDHVAQLIRVSLNVNMACMTEDQKDTAQKIIDRMELCEKLQNSERKAK